MSRLFRSRPQSLARQVCSFYETTFRDLVANYQPLQNVQYAERLNIAPQAASVAPLPPQLTSPRGQCEVATPRCPIDNDAATQSHAALNDGSTLQVVLDTSTSSNVTALHNNGSGNEPHAAADNQEAKTPRTAWNKGMTLTPESRRKLSASIKKKWKDPEYRETITAAMKGKDPWNKGRTLSEETREKMRLAKLNHNVSRATRQKMSEARRGRPLTPEAAALVSAKLTGQPKSDEHRQKIAAAQRRRHAAARVLSAVEAVYQQQLTQRGGAVGGNTATSKGKNNVLSPDVTLTTLGLKPTTDSKNKPSKPAFLNSFKSELREFRALQDELSPWVSAFEERHNRKPCLVDVQRTGISWLWTRYKRYIVLRQRLFSDSSILRGQMQGAVPLNADSLHLPSTSLGSNHRVAVGDSNSSSPATAAVSSINAAFQYKHHNTAATNNNNSTQQQQSRIGDAFDSSSPAAASSNILPNIPGLSNNHSLEDILMEVGTQIPARVKLALQTALEYRNNSARATKEAVEAAAQAARSGKSAAAAGATGKKRGRKPRNATTTTTVASGDGVIA